MGHFQLPVTDARLTSMLLLCLIYIGYITLVSCFTDSNRADRVGGLLLIIGLINIPIIKFSVNLWTTLHQKSSIFRAEGPAIHSDILFPLIWMFVGMILLSCNLIILQADNLIIRKKITKMMMICSRRVG